MKVIYVVSSDSYQYKKISESLINYLTQYMKLLGVNNETWLYKSSGSKVEEKKRSANRAPIKYLYFPSKLEHDLEGKYMSQKFSLNKPNLIHIFDPVEITNLSKYVSKLKIPYVITFTNDKLIKELTSDDETENFRKILANALQVTVTTKEIKEVLTKHKLNMDDVVVIPHVKRENIIADAGRKSEELESELFKYFQIYNIVR